LRLKTGDTPLSSLVEITRRYSNSFWHILALFTAAEDLGLALLLCTIARRHGGTKIFALRRSFPRLTRLSFTLPEKVIFTLRPNISRTLGSSCKFEGIFPDLVLDQHNLFSSIIIELRTAQSTHCKSLIKPGTHHWSTLPLPCAERR
jgi:hypothetical protein